MVIYKTKHIKQYLLFICLASLLWSGASHDIKYYYYYYCCAFVKRGVGISKKKQKKLK